jgi:hypothetical protein
MKHVPSCIVISGGCWTGQMSVQAWVANKSDCKVSQDGRIPGGAAYPRQGVCMASRQSLARTPFERRVRSASRFICSGNDEFPGETGPVHPVRVWESWRWLSVSTTPQNFPIVSRLCLPLADFFNAERKAACFGSCVCLCVCFVTLLQPWSHVSSSVPKSPFD